jgi:hypothetical protein
MLTVGISRSIDRVSIISIVLRKRLCLGSLNFRLYNRKKSRQPGVRSMASKSQRKATSAHRRRAAARGLVRVEVQAPKKDAGLIRALAETLRGKPERAEALRSTLAKALIHPEVKTAFDIFGSELPDEAFAGVFDQPRQRDLYARAASPHSRRRR